MIQLSTILLERTSLLLNFANYVEAMNMRKLECIFNTSSSEADLKAAQARQIEVVKTV